jgi:hypothetical protein
MAVFRAGSGSRENFYLRGCALRDIGVSLGVNESRAWQCVGGGRPAAGADTIARLPAT